MIVLDASAWVDVVTGIIAPLNPLDHVVVPPHFDAEVLGALRSLDQRGLIPDGQAQLLLDQHLRADFTVDRHVTDIRRAWGWRETMSFSDAWYATLAVRHQCRWVTRDARAAAAARQHRVDVHVPEPST